MVDDTTGTNVEGDPIVVVNTDPKMWYTSVELWTSLIAVIAFILQGIFGNFILPADTQAAIVSLILLVLRAIRPPRPLAWTKAHFQKLVAALA